MSARLQIVFTLLALSSAIIAGQTSTPPVTRLLQFDRALVLDHTSDDAANVSIGDLTGDGSLDIVLAKGRHSPAVNRVFVNDGHGRFPVARDLGGIADRSYSAGLVDIDGDGDLDVVVSNDTPDPKPVHLNDGKGNFQVGSTYGRPEWPMRNASIADLNRDGLADIVAANRTGSRGGANYVCLNRGKGKFDADCLEFSRESATTITPADINRDGFIDLIVPHREGGQSHVYLNDGNARFPKRVPFGPANAAIRVAAAADLDGNGLVDIVAIDERQGTYIYFNQPGDSFAGDFQLAANKPVPYALEVGDVNGDGKIDVLVGNISAASTVYFNDGSGRIFTPVQFGDAQGAVYGFAIGDLDEDGHLDIAVARSGASNVVYFGAPGLPRVNRTAVSAARPPGPGLISGFDGATITAAFGNGWQPASDVIQGGRSVASLRLASGGGVRGSAGSLLIEGEIAQSAHPMPWAGTAFWPAPEIRTTTANLSGFARLSFWAKGDGGTYTVELASSTPFRGGRVTFVAGSEWREYAFDLSAFGVDTRRVLWVVFSAGPKPGRFAFQLDEVRLQ
jgi:hypothetical protein